MRFFKKYSFYIPVILIVLASFLHFYKLSEWFFFNIDEDWFSFIVRKIVVEKKPVLIGWEIPGGFYVPPVMYYYGSLLMFLFKSNPLGLAINAAVFSTIGLLLIFWTGKALFHSNKIALYTLLIFGFSYIANIYNRVTLTLYLGPVLALLTYLSLYKIIKEKRKNWLWALGFVSVFATQEGSLLSLIILIIASLFIFRVKFKIKDYLAPLFLFLMSFFPLVIFDLRHNFQLINRLTSIFRLESINPSSFNWLSMVNFLRLLPRTFVRMLIPTGPNDLNIQILPCQSYLKIIEEHTPNFYFLIGILLIIFFVFFPLTKKTELGRKIITLHLLIVFFGLIIYSFINPGHLYEWFFVVLFPAFCFITAFFLNFLSRYKFGKFFVILFFIFFLWINIKSILTGTAVVGYKDKIAAVRYATTIVDDKKFSLEILGNRCNGYGYRYLFTYLNKEPVKSYMDYQYADWLYPKSQEKEPPTKIFLVPLADLDTENVRKEYERLKEEAIQIKKFGNLEVLLIED